MTYIPGGWRNGCIIFLGEFKEALLEGGAQKGSLLCFRNGKFMVCKLYLKEAVKNDRGASENSSSTGIFWSSDTQYMYLQESQRKEYWSLEHIPHKGGFCLIVLVGFLLWEAWDLCLTILSFLGELFPDAWSFSRSARSVAPSIAGSFYLRLKLYFQVWLSIMSKKCSSKCNLKLKGKPDLPGEQVRGRIMS